MIVVAEVAQAHDGSLGTAIAYVKAIAEAGADAAKFQDHLGDKCNRFRPGMDNAFPQDIDRKAYWIRTGFALPEWAKIREACREQGIEYIVSPFSMAAFDRQAGLNPDCWKIASSKVNDHELIDACVQTGKPVIVSSGMSTCSELGAAVARIPKPQATLLQCTSCYPCPPEKICLAQAWGMYGEFGVTPGLSDHSGFVWPSIVAAWAGMSMTEVHVAFSRECFGPDVTSSITTAELRQLVDGVRFVERMLSHEFGKDEMAEQLKETREVFCA